MYGRAAWRASVDARAITAAHVARAMPVAHRDLERNLCQTRWGQAPDSEQTYLRAVAALTLTGAQFTGSKVAERLGMTTRAASSRRARLLAKGTQGEHLSFAVPGMAAWVDQQPDADPGARHGATRRGAR